jgi:hypothetical protein
VGSYGVVDEVEHEVIGDEFALGELLLDDQAQRGLLVPLGPQQLPGGDLRQAVVALDALRLRALALYFFLKGKKYIIYSSIR